ncbi:MAG: hypothetical protein ACI35R_06460 [Bacillus sp. (in: firmicutes)]
MTTEHTPQKKIEQLHWVEVIKMKELTKEELNTIVRRQSNAIKAMHRYIFGNENIKEDDREALLNTLATVIRLY